MRPSGHYFFQGLFYGSDEPTKLVVSDGWKNLSELIQVEQEDEEVEEEEKKVSDYLEDHTFRGEILDRWGVSLYLTDVKKYSQSKGFLKKIIHRKPS